MSKSKADINFIYTFFFCIFLIIILIIYKLQYLLNNNTKLEDNKNDIKKFIKNGYLISISILPIFSEDNDSYSEYYSIIDYLDKISTSNNIYKRNKMSIKIQQLSMNKGLQWERLDNLVNYANKKNIFVWLSAINRETLDIEYDFYLRLISNGYKNVGITLAAYNSNLSKKTDHILNMKGHVRLVKGIYEGNIYNNNEIDKMYVDNGKKLIDSGYYHTLATHDFKILNFFHKYNEDFNSYIEIAYFYNSYNYVKNELKSSPIKTKFMSFYIFHGNKYLFMKDNFKLYSIRNKFKILKSKINSFLYY